MLSIYHKTIKDKKLKLIDTLKQGSWINVIEPKEEDLKSLEKLKIDPSFIEDALDPDELPRIEREKGIAYVLLNAPCRKKGKIFNIPFLITLSRDFFVVLSGEKLDFLKPILKSNKTYTTQKVKNLIKICLKITNLYTKEIRRINKEINSKKVNLSKLKNEDIIAFVELEEGLNEFITALIALIGVFEKIRSGKFIKVFETDENMLEDLITDSYQGLDMCRASIKKIINIREAYSTILTNNLNKVMKMLASLAIILGVPTIIASLYGMNVKLPLQSNPFAFSYISLATVLICLFLILVFYLKKWL